MEHARLGRAKTMMGALRVGLLVALLTTTVHSTSQPQIFDLANVNENFKELYCSRHDCLGNIESCPEGFTLQFSFTPSKSTGTPGVTTYFFSNGEESLRSGGISFRKIGDKEYEVSVSRRDKRWEGKLHLTDNRKSTITITWSLANGLAYYVDAINAGAKSTAESKDYFQQTYDPYPCFVVGKAASDIRTTGNIRVSDFKFWTRAFSSQEVRALGGDELLHQGCVTSLPAGVASQAVSGPTKVADCRALCFQENSQKTALLKGDQCACYASREELSKVSTIEALAQCSADTVWQVYFTSGQRKGVEYPVGLKVTHKVARAKNFVTVTVDATVTTNERTEFRYDFGESTEKTLLDRRTSHVYRSEGDKAITVIAKTAYYTETKKISVKVEFLDEGVAPQPVRVILKQGADRQVISELMTYSTHTTHCKIAFGDNSAVVNYPNLEGGHVIHRLKHNHTFALCGVYHVAVECTNKFGTTEVSENFVAQNKTIPEVPVAKGRDIVIPLYDNPHTDKDIAVSVDKTDVKFTRQSAGLKLLHTNFPTSKRYVINIFYVINAVKVPILTRICDVQGAIGDVMIKPNVQQSEPGEVINFEFSTGAGGDRMFTAIDYGDGSKTDYRFFPLRPSGNLILRHSFKKLGVYTMTFSAANEVSELAKKEEISIETQIKSASASAANVTDYGTAVTFIARYETDVDHSVPVDLIVNYGNGETPGVEHCRPKPSDTTDECRHTHRYPDNGIYRVAVTVKNNISSIVAKSFVLQVGHNLTYVDVYVQKPRMVVSEDTEIRVDVGGSSVTTLICFGDNTCEKVVPTPNKNLKKSGSDGKDDDDDGSGLIEVTTAAVVINATDISNGTALGGTVRDRKRRDTSSDEGSGDSEDEDESGQRVKVRVSNSISPRGTLIFKKSYATVGYYRVTVTATNSFGNMSSWHCPTVIVTSASQRQDTTCQAPEVTMAEDSVGTISTPLVTKRSENYNITAMAVLNCKTTQTATYTWNASWFPVAGNYEITRPELQVCTFESSSPELRIRPLTLQYGLYKISVTVSTENLKLVTGTAMTYLSVGKTPLKAVIDKTQASVTKDQSVSMVMTKSHDPDVSNALNRTGMAFHVVCYPKASQERVQQILAAGLEDGLKTMTFLKQSNSGIVKLYDSGGCFKENTNTSINIIQTTINFPARIIQKFDKQYYFSLYLAKDDRMSNDTADLTVLSSTTTDGMMGQIDDLLSSGNKDAALGVINSVAGSLNSDTEGEIDEEQKKQRTQMRTKLITFLADVSGAIDSTDQLYNTANCLDMVTQGKGEVTENAKENAAKALGGVGKSTKQFASQPVDAVKGVGSAVLGAVSNLLPDSQPKEEVVDRKRRTTNQDLGKDFELGEKKENETDEEFELRTPCCLRSANMWCGRSICDYDLGSVFDDMDDLACEAIHPDDIEEVYIAAVIEQLEKEKQEKYAGLRKVSSGSMSAVNDVGEVLVGKADDDAAGGIELNSAKLSLKVAKADPSKGSDVSSDSGGIKMPAGAMSQFAGGKSVGTKFTGMKSNPFGFSDSAADVTSDIVALELLDSDGKPIKVSGAAEPIRVEIKGKPSDAPEFLKNVVLPAADKKSTKMNCHKIKVDQNDTAMFFQVQPEDQGDQFLVRVKKGGPSPNVTEILDNDFETTLPVPEDVDPGASEATKLAQRFTMAIPPNVTALNDTYHVCVVLNGTKDFTEVDGIPAHANKTYRHRVFSTSCKYWNTEFEEWRSDGCEVSSVSNVERTVCLCTHLTSFGGGFVVPPNTIDFSTVFAKFKNLSENAAVFSTVVSIIGVYIIALIWARWADKKDILKWGATPLEDNLPSDNYHYQITLYTGIKKEAATKSKVSFIMSGDDGDSGVRRLYDGKRNDLPRGSIYNYILSVDHCLGPLSFLRIWHDNSGKGKMRSWYLDQVQVIDLQTSDKYFFLNDRWLAVEEDDGMVDRIIPVAGLNDLTSFKHLFGNSVRKKISNDHLWVSIFSRPTRSSFTRVQRISCCVSLLFCTMITNAMWFKSEGNSGYNPEALHVGPFSFTLGQLFISLASTLIVFPVNMALVTIFKKCRPKQTSIMQMNQQLSSKSKRFQWRKMDPGSSWWGSAPQKSKYDKFKDSMHGILTFHTKSKYETEASNLDMQSSKKKKKKKKPWTLPWWCIYFAYILCFFSVIGSGFFTILYSMQWGKEKAEEWLSTFFLSFFQSVIVVQPFKVLALAAFISCILKKPDLGEEEEMAGGNNPLANVMANHDEKMDPAKNKTQKEIQAILMRRKMEASDIKPPDLKSLQKTRDLRLKEIAMGKVIKELLVYFFFILVLFFLSYQTRDPQSFGFAQTIKGLFSNGIDSISTPPTTWKWINKDVIPGLFAGPWYNGKRLDWRESQCLAERDNVRVGVARIRQHRVKDDSCSTRPVFRSLIKKICRDDYGLTDDDAKDYLIGWREPPRDNDTYMEWLEDQTSDPKLSPWIYQNSLKLKSAPYMGTRSMFKGGGYTLNFRRGARATKLHLKRLEKATWLDVNTRSVFVEFTLYNANVNLFASVVLLIEFMATGGALPRYEVKVFRLYNYVGGFGVVVLSMEIIFGIFSIYFIVHEFNKLRKQRLKYFQDFWNLIEFATLVFSVTAVAMYFMKQGFGSVAMKTLHASGSGDYVNFLTIGIWDEIFTWIVGIIVFLSTIKFLKLLKFNKRMGLLGDTVKACTKDLKLFMITFFIYFFSFCMAGYLLFGRHLKDYLSFVTTIESLFAFSLGVFDFDAFRETQPTLGPLFFFAYIMVVYIGLMGMFMTIINDAYVEVMENTDLQGNEYEIVDFICNKIKGMFGCAHRKDVDIEDIDEAIKEKKDEMGEPTAESAT